jgi:pimeloyl-ACP methyl ester carboxylesterase
MKPTFMVAISLSVSGPSNLPTQSPGPRALGEDLGAEWSPVELSAPLALDIAATAEASGPATSSESIELYSEPAASGAEPKVVRSCVAPAGAAKDASSRRSPQQHHRSRYYGVTDATDVAWMRSRLTPHPWKSFTQPLALLDPATVERLPRTNINCIETLGSPSTRTEAASARQLTPISARQLRGAQTMRFVLIHGGFHGAWCWSRVVPELERLGHEGVAIDLPGHGERKDEERTFDGRLAVTRSVMQEGDVLVGHSGGGFDITMAADAAPDLVSHVIYLAAAFPREGRTMSESLVQRDGAIESIDAVDEVTGMMQYLSFGENGSMWFNAAEGARQLFYHDCDDATVEWAFERLTPEAPGPDVDRPVTVPRFWEADLPRSYIICSEDRAQPRWLADLNSGRLGVEPLMIGGSHSPFLSRPSELAELFVHATTTKPIGHSAQNDSGLTQA